MQKRFVAKIALAGTVGVAAALAAGAAGAAICSDCHTMHNSQNGVSMRFDGGATPLPVLLRDDCLGCHTGLNTAPGTTGNPPKVIANNASVNYSGLQATGAANTTLGGGDFYWVANGNNAAGHNVVGVANVDTILGNKPPGGGIASLGTQLKCAGTAGCHGNTLTGNQLASLEGAHHFAHNTVAGPLLTANKVGNSFRFLLGIKGAEDSDWQFTESTTDHNYYAGVARTSATAAVTDTISGLCARCHGAYHNTVQGGADTFGINTNNGAFAGAGSWIRHPTDYDMVTTTAREYGFFTTYQPETPVGRLATAASMADAGDDVSANHRIVLCVTCHRAHGSPNDDMLRWTYTAMTVGTGVTHGCMNCHTAK